MILSFMKRTFFLLLSICSLLSVGCRRTGVSHRWWQKSEHIKVLCTLAFWNDLVQEIGGEYVESIALIEGDLDPHSYELVKGDQEKIDFADIIFCNGLGLEHGASLQYQLQTNPKSFALGSVLPKKSLIHVDGAIDPHIWMDISLVAQLCLPIAKKLGGLDPKHRTFFYQRAKNLKKKLLKEHEKIFALLQSIDPSKRFLITTHDAFRYFVRIYLAKEEERGTIEWQKRLASPEGLAPDGQISTGDIKRIVDFALQHQLRTVFAESNLSQSSLKKIVYVTLEKGGELAIADEPLYGDAMKEGYLQTLWHNSQMIYNSMEGE